MLTRYRHSNEWPQSSPFPMLSWTSPWRTLDVLTHQLNRAWEDLERFGEGQLGYNQTGEIRDTGNALELKVDLPGVSNDAVELSVTGDSVFVRAEREVAVPKGYSAHRRERSSYKFERAWKLVAPVDAQKAEAQLQNGVLTVLLPKAPNAQTKQISVKAG